MVRVKVRKPRFAIGSDAQYRIDVKQFPTKQLKVDLDFAQRYGGATTRLGRSNIRILQHELRKRR